jgi:hypothetical protein
MNSLLYVVIVLGRCCRSRRPFGIRFEEKGRNRWLADWAFAVKETTAGREGYDRGEITGSFSFDSAFPGCPSCEAGSLFKRVCLSEMRAMAQTGLRGQTLPSPTDNSSAKRSCTDRPLAILAGRCLY